jgi:T5SS/PEP-CTERM-associated repeat protein
MALTTQNARNPVQCRKRIAIVLSFAAAMPGSTVFGQPKLWNVSSGAWQTTTNWWPAGIPTAATDADINNSGTARVTAAGGQVRDVSLGRLASQSGHLVINGPGTLASRVMYVGREGNGTLTIQNGGQLSNSGTGSIGLESSPTTIASGVVTITGAGSQWTNGGSISIGEQGTGTLSILSGAMLSNRHAIIATLNSQADGNVIVDGLNSKWMNSGDLEIGGRGTATISIRNRAMVTSNSASIDSYSGIAPATVIVDGAGTRWTNTTNITLGSLIGTGLLNIRNSGIVFADTVDVSNGSIVQGNGALTADVINAGTFAPGNSIGAMRVNGDYTQTNKGKLQIQLASPENLDALRVTGHITLGGTLAISLASGFTPAAGASFDILDWTRSSGAFHTVELPPLQEGFTWNTSQLYFDGKLSIVGSALAGDLNGDGNVDAADYVVWRKGDGTQAGYDAWRSNYGRTRGGGSGATRPSRSEFLVPEPFSCSLALAVVIIAVLGTRSPRSSRIKAEKRRWLKACT